MDSNLQSASLTLRPKSERMMTPEQKAEMARRRILEALQRLNSSRGLSISAIGLALFAGFAVGSSPGASRMLMNNMVGVLRFLASLRL